MAPRASAGTTTFFRIQRRVIAGKAIRVECGDHVQALPYESPIKSKHRPERGALTSGRIDWRRFGPAEADEQRQGKDDGNARHQVRIGIGGRGIAALI